MRRATLVVWAGIMVPLLVPDTTSAQGIVVEVRSTLGDVPVTGALVTPIGTARTFTSDRIGRIRIPNLGTGALLAVSAIGFAPDTVTVSQTITILLVRLSPVPVVLGELSAQSGGTGLARAGSWTVPRGVIRTLPAAVEPDPIRALQTVPSVTFSSPLSSRPIVRGYDASMTTVRIDGYEVLTPYHIGRIFSTFPANAVDAISVTPGTPGSDQGGSLAGVVDVTGRRAVTKVEGGADLALTSLTGWVGTNQAVPTFGAGRLATLEGASKLIGAPLPYSFADGYLRSSLPLGGDRSSELTLFLSRDRLGHSRGGLFMRWSNVLLGNRIRLQESPRGSLELTTFWNAFRATGREVPSRGQEVNLRNRFDQLSATLQGDRSIGSALLRFGGGVGARRTTSTLTPLRRPDQVFNQHDRFLEGNGFVEISGRIGETDIVVGGRVDANAAQAVFGPSITLGRDLADDTRATLRAGRSTRLYQQITDVQAEPDLAFFDLWLTAGRDGVPTPRIDHLSLDVDHDAGPVRLAGAAFLSRGRGLGELRPSNDLLRDDPTGIRYGKSRTHGVELRTSWASATPGGANAALSYVVSWSDRQWEDGKWRAWALDRRHLLRFQTDLSLGRGWRFGGVGEFQSGQPITPVIAVVTGEPFGPTLQFGEESSGRGAGTLRFDLSLRKRFGGPGRSHFELGFSRLNAGFGPVAPSVPKLTSSTGQLFPNGVEYERLFNLPAVPSFTLRWEF